MTHQTKTYEGITFSIGDKVYRRNNEMKFLDNYQTSVISKINTSSVTLIKKDGTTINTELKFLAKCLCHQLFELCSDCEEDESDDSDD